MKKNIIVGQSGGPTVAINASLAGVIREAMRRGDVGEVFGMRNGVEGMLRENIIPMRGYFKNANDFARLASTPAMALGSCRYKLPNPPHDNYAAILKILRERDIGCLIYIRGNDSMNTVRQLSDYFKSEGEDIKCVGVPKTVDNDLPVTDHTPGFGSAAKYVSQTVSELALDSSVYDMFNVVIVEIMGRNAGWLTASAALARDSGAGAPHLIYLPEPAFDPEAIIEKINGYSKIKQLLIVAISEGLRTADGKYLSASGPSVDGFGNPSLSGAGKYLENFVKNRLKCKVRSIELSLLQRAAGHFASAVDIREAERVGEEAVRAYARGETAVMIAIRRVSDEPYLADFISVPVEECAGKEKTVPSEWIVDGCDVNEEMIRYLRPLVAGRAEIFERDGAPDYFRFA
jgi:6-phosphofructokinase 1